MSDQCGNCTVKGDFAKCQITGCGHHETWYAKQMQAELEAAQTQSRCDLIGGEPGHQKLLCDKLQAELDAKCQEYKKEQEIWFKTLKEKESLQARLEVAEIQSHCSLKVPDEILMSGELPMLLCDLQAKDARVQNQKIIDLEQEKEAIKRELYSCQHANKECEVLGTKLRDECRKLRADLEAARADSARLDWMESRHESLYTVYNPAPDCGGTLTPGAFRGWLVGHEDEDYPTVREAIDAAMEEKAREE